MTDEMVPVPDDHGASPYGAGRSTPVEEPLATSQTKDQGAESDTDEMRTDDSVHDLAFDMAADDVLTAWRVRNAALMVAASFVHPGPDGEDYKIRREMVREWVSDGHDQVEEENRQRTQMLGRMVRAEHEAARLREGLQAITALAASGHAASGGILRAANEALTEAALFGSPQGSTDG